MFEVTMPDAFRGEELFIKIMSTCSGASNNSQIVQRLMATSEGREVWKSLLDFVKIVPASIPRPIDKQDIESPQTLVRLRTESLSMLMDFITE
ncbi:hypothetical protein [Orbus hercynius]|nr:hypothetical protein [Orbus hercynius]